MLARSYVLILCFFTLFCGCERLGAVLLSYCVLCYTVFTVLTSLKHWNYSRMQRQQQTEPEPGMRYTSGKKNTQRFNLIPPNRDQKPGSCVQIGSIVWLHYVNVYLSVKSESDMWCGGEDLWQGHWGQVKTLVHPHVMSDKCRGPSHWERMISLFCSQEALLPTRPW